MKKTTTEGDVMEGTAGFATESTITQSGQILVWADHPDCEHEGDRYEMVINGVLEWRCAECGILAGSMPFDLPVGYSPYA